MSCGDIASLAVIGGGPAGAATCVALGQLGQRPLWIAPRQPAGQRIGESLSPAANPILTALGLGDVIASSAHRRANATFSAWGSDRLVERNAAVHLEGPGLVIDRPAFENRLTTAAIEAGAEPVDAQLRAARHEDGLWRLQLDDGSERLARFLLDCTGRKAMAARRMARRHRADRLLAHYAILDQLDPEIDPTPATLIEAVAEGWWYATLLPAERLGRPRLVIACFSDPDLLPHGLARNAAAWKRLVDRTAYVSRWIETAGFGLAGPPRRAAAATTWLEPAAGGGDGAVWAAVGDAAAAFDPLSSHGLTTAMWSARRAAEGAVAALSGNPAPLADYARAVARGIARFRRQHVAIHAREQRFADRPFWLRRHLADDSGANPLPTSARAPDAVPGSLPAMPERQAPSRDIAR